MDAQPPEAWPPVVQPATDPLSSPPQRLAFLHIPKTGGTALTAALAKRWPRLRVVEGVQTVELLPADLAAQFDLVAGHFYAFQLAHPAFRGFAPVTILREPFARLLSSWRYMRHCVAIGIRPTPGMAFAAKVDFPEYAFSGAAAADRHGHLMHLGLDSFAEAPVTPLGVLLERALRRLRGMRVGVTEELPLFLGHLAAEAGCTGPVALGRLQVTEGAEPDGLSAVQRATLREVMAPDYALYDAAREMMLRRVAAGPPPVPVTMG
ncbi:MAG TPA: hypothetical protein VE684_13655 [Crenalkalicoccus sp.]|nr:hypothetical protein [Crenalkalicoccus sp.]